MTDREKAARLRKDARLLDTGMDPALVRELHAEADALDPPLRQGGGLSQLFAVGQAVRFSDSIIAAAPKYKGQTYTILAATAAWGIGRRNEWYGEYMIQDALGHKAVTSQSCLVAA